jgi:hypothetical protein
MLTRKQTELFMRRTSLSREEAAEVDRLIAGYDAAAIRQVNIIKTHGMDSREFREGERVMSESHSVSGKSAAFRSIRIGGRGKTWAECSRLFKRRLGSRPL